MVFAAPTELAIFDCDGVLVDSEDLSAMALLRMASPFGLRLSAADAKSLFHGRKLSACLEDIERQIGRALPVDFVDKYRTEMSAVFAAELKPIVGVRDAIDAMDIPRCVASSGPRSKIEFSLTITGLLPYFVGRIFSAYEVGSWKPEPGLFLHAAKACGTEPHACTVVEDSLPGVLAGVAAGMRVLAYIPIGDHSIFVAAGATTFRHMQELPELMKQ